MTNISNTQPVNTSAEVVQGKPLGGDPTLLHALDFLQLELTHACNLKCVHCYTESAPHTGANDRLGTADYQRLMREAHDLGARRVQFLGGEPTLNRDLAKLVEYAKAVGFEDIEIYSNLTTHVTKDLLDYAVRMGVRFGTTFHSCDPDREDRFTQVKGSFARKTRNVKAILDRGLMVRSGVIIADQPKEDVEATLSMLEGLGITNLRNDRVRDFGRAREKGEGAQVAELCGNCWKGSLAIASDGTAYACPFSRDWPVGNVQRNGLDVILKGVALKDIRRRVFDEVTTRTQNAACWPFGDDCHPRGDCGPCSPSTCNPCGPCNPSGCNPQSCSPN